MDLIVNSMAAMRSSRGVRRLFDGIMQHLSWSDGVSFTVLPRFSQVGRLQELLHMGRRDAIFWSPAHRGPLWAHHHVFSLHDCINVEYTYRNDWRLPAFRSMFNRILANAQTVVTLSRATREAALRNYVLDESKIVVIPPGFDAPEKTAGAIETPSHADQPFVLMICNQLPHKNALRACRAFINSRAPRNGYALRIVGSLPSAADALGLTRRAKIEVHAHVPDTTLSEWYKSAAFLFSPSLAEGYNLPVAEAIASGGNVVCSDIAVHHEFFDGRAAFVDPTSEDAMVDALNEAITKVGTCWHPVAPGTVLRTFKDVADDYREVFRGIEKAREK